MIRPAQRMQRLAEKSSELTWDIARLFPSQGDWSEEEYLSLPTNHLIELSNGRLEFLPMPTLAHQLIAMFLHDALRAFISGQVGGVVVMAPVPVRLWEMKWREPDVIYLRPERVPPNLDYPLGADLVIEVVSPNDPDRDWKTKRREYAKAGIREYWIVDPRKRCIVVLSLKKRTYHVHGEFGLGSRATSVLLRGFGVSVDDVFAAARKNGRN